ncbi:5-deoxy-glucuronate isomerase [Streptococcus respiraculi]|uniref:5-deoxy-glucuronate isomerase n=1 Tax=Streptococcus respiraculi TaxID=2021971 RepID=UPI000E765D88|nr:5-deoxy-glucuronate isomerase [Streptococcus respiraculi]
MQLIKHPIYFPLTKGVELIQYVNRKNSRMKYTSVEVYELQAEAEMVFSTEQDECCAVILCGQASLFVDSETSFLHLGTRESVFEKKPTDSVYLGIESQCKVVADTDCRILLAKSPTTVKKPTKLLSHQDVAIEFRGKNQNQRRVHTMLSDTSEISDRLLVVEVYTDSGHFSSYPPHKHDEDNLPKESMLEELYYHEIFPAQGFVFQRVYTDDRLLDTSLSCHNKDIVLVPKGYHPVGVPDGYESYYLNIMAGPQKVWKFTDDPDHQWTKNR